MNGHMERVLANLLPRSKAQIYDEARKEWDWNGLVIDHGDAAHICELCSQEQLRYHYPIHNRFTMCYLNVGSQCIKKFIAPPFGVSDDDWPKSIDKALVDLKEEQRQTRLAAYAKVLEPIGFDLDAEKFARKGWSPKQIGYALWLLVKAGCPHVSFDFKVNLRSVKAQNQIAEMERWKFDRIKPCLSTAQRGICSEIRGYPVVIDPEPVNVPVDLVDLTSILDGFDPD